MEPITFITGTPGAGKTLYSVTHIEKERLSRQLPVFYHGIPELKLGWTALQKAEDWHQVEGPAIVVIDEAHRVFPQRPPGSKAPEHVLPFDQLRHHALEVVLITQHPAEIDHYIKHRVGRHVHLERVFGQKYAKVFEWQELGTPKDYHSLQKALKSKFIYPSKSFEVYKSATQHLQQPRLPWFKLGGLAVLVVAIIGLAFFAASTLSFGVEKPAVSAVSAPAVPKRIDTPADQAAHWSSRFVERVAGVPYSASLYDSMIAPASIPKISGCLELKVGYRVRCKCNTQQGTIIQNLPVAQCQHYVRNGWFDFTRADIDEPTGGSAGPYQSEGASNGGAAAGRPNGPAAPAVAQAASS